MDLFGIQRPLFNRYIRLFRSVPSAFSNSFYHGLKLLEINACSIDRHHAPIENTFNRTRKRKRRRRKRGHNQSIRHYYTLRCRRRHLFCIRRWKWKDEHGGKSSQSRSRVSHEILNDCAVQPSIQSTTGEYKAKKTPNGQAKKGYSTERVTYNQKSNLKRVTKIILYMCICYCRVLRRTTVVTVYSSDKI